MPYTGHNISRTQPALYKSYVLSNGRWVFQGDSGFASIPWHNDMVYSSTKRPLPKGWRPPSAYDRYIDTWHLKPGWRRSTSGSTGSMDVGVIWTGISGGEPPAVPSSVRNALHFAVLDRVKNRKMDLGVSLAEFPKTARMVGSAAKTIAQSILLARRGKFSQAAEVLGLDSSLLKDVSKKWLAIQYGWTPLMMDVDSGCRALSEGLGDWRYGATASRPYPYGDGAWPGSGHSVTRTGTRFLKLRLDFEVDNAKAMTYSQLGLTNPVSIAWELVPFSFVADWFVPIGNWLDALDIGMFCKFKGGTFTDFYDIRDTHHGQNTVSGSITTVAVYEHVRHRRKLARSTIPSYLPSIVAKPDFSLSLKQMASGLSLLQEVVVRGRR